MTNFILKAAKPLAGLAVSALIATSAFAGESAPANLRSWAKDAGQSVDAVMAYPRLALLRGEEGNTHFRVTVNADGDVVNVEQTERAFSNMINGAAKKVIQKADFPALPAGKAKMTFGVKLVYAIANSPEEAAALKREGRVTGQELAANGAPMMASIEILEDADE